MEIEEDQIKQKISKMKERAKTGAQESLNEEKRVPEFMKSYKIKTANP